MVSIGPKIQITGEDSYRLSIRRIIQETKELNTEMDLMVAKFEKNESAMSKNTKMHDMYAKQVDSAKKQLDEFRTGLDSANKKHADAIKVYEDHTKKIASLESEQKRIVATMDSLERAGSKGSATWEGLNKQLAENKAALEGENTALNKANDEINRSGRVLADWGSAVNKAEIELAKLEEQMRDTTWVKGLGEDLQDIGDKFEEFGEIMSTHVTAPLVALSGYAIKAAADFEDGMAKIWTIAVDGAEPYEKMHDEIIQLSNETGFALDDLAEATYQAVSASVPATEAVDFMTQATKLARAGFTSTTKSVDILSTVLNSYGKDAYDVAQISDILLKTQNDGKLVIDDLASTFGMIIPLASNYNVGLEQIAASYATMTKQGVPASKATTFLRAVFTELEKESSDVADILMDKTGKSFAQLMDDGNDLSDVLRILYKHVGGNAEEFQRLFGNVRATQAVAALVTDDFAVLDKELEAMENSAGQTDKALEQMETNQLKAKRAVNQLKNSVTDLGEEMIDLLSPAFEVAVDKVRSITDGFNALTDESKQTIIIAGALAAAIGPVATITGKLLGYIGGLMAGTASIIPLIAGVTTVMIGLTTMAQVHNEEMMAAAEAEYGLSDAMKQAITDLDALQTSHSEFQISMQQETTEILNTANTAQRLAEEYDKLVGANGQVDEANKATADYLLGELATALGLNKDQIVALIDENGKLSTSIQQTIADYEKKARVAVFEQQLTEAINREIEAERINKEATANLADASKKLGDASKANKDAIEAVNEATANGTPVTQAMRDEVTRTSSELGVAQAAFRDARAAVDESAQAMYDAQNDIEFYKDKLKTAGDQAEKTASQVESGAKKSETAVSNSSGNISTTLEQTGNKGYTTGTQLINGFANGISDRAWYAATAAANAGTWASRALKNSLQVASPSKLTYETGQYFVEGFANAIKAGANQIADMGALLGESAANGLSMGSYVPEYGNVRNVNAPISINLTVNGNVDDPKQFARSLSDDLADILYRESEVFA